VETLIRIAGYDERLVARLAGDHAKFFAGASVLSVVASVLASLGMGYGAWLAFQSMVAAVFGGLVAGPVVLNLFRMHHAGTGYSIHLPIEGLARWRPSLAAAMVLSCLGAMLLQPLVLFAMKPFTDGAVASAIAAEVAELARVGGDVSTVAEDGIIRRAHATWNQPLIAVLLTLLLALLVSAPAWLRRVFVTDVRAYERLRWIDDRMFVDDAFADAQDLIHRALEDEPHYSGRLQLHFADPPYNTRPIFFGVDPLLVEREGVKFVKGEEGEAAKEEVPAEPPPAPPPKAPPAPMPTAEEAKVAPESEAASPPAAMFAWDDSLDAGDPPDPSYLDVGRLPARVARRHPEEVVAFVVAFTGRDEQEVRDLLRVAPDDMPVHKLFSEWTRLPTILMKGAGFALDHGLSGIIAIIVDKPVDEVERRLRAAPRNRRLTGVFTSELARRILGEDVSSS